MYTYNIKFRISNDCAAQAAHVLSGRHAQYTDEAIVSAQVVADSDVAALKIVHDRIDPLGSPMNEIRVSMSR